MHEHAGVSLRAASQKVGTEVAQCSICNPDTCYQRHRKNKEQASPAADPQKRPHYQTKYWRFDQTAPPLAAATSLVLPAIPDALRIPPARFDDIDAYVRATYARPGNATGAFLLEYNPGLAPIPARMRTHLPPNARYVLSLRVTPHNFCFPVRVTEALPEEIKQTMHSLNHLGLALLDAHYHVIPGHDVVIDIDRQMDAKKGSGHMGEPAFVDYRLFALNGALYLHINADTVIVTQLRLRSKDMGETTTTNADHEEEAVLQNGGEKQYTLRNVYGGDRLQVTLLHQFNTIWGVGKHWSYGKNYALFAVPNATHPAAPDAVYAEMSVHPEHLVQRIFPDEHEHIPKDRRIKWRQRRNFKIDHMIQRRMRTGGNATRSLTSDSHAAAVPSFFSADELWFPGSKNPFKDFAHGGACCVSLPAADRPGAAEGAQWEGVDAVLVGVGHTLTTVR